MSKRILIVDDSVAARKLCGMALAKAGYEVVEATDGADGVSKLTGKLHLIISDVNMPRMDGYKFVAALRRSGPNRTAPVVMISTESATADAEAAYAAGANVYLNKPVAADELIGVVLALTGRTRP